MAKILIVEDDKDLNNAYRIILKHEGHEVESTYDGKQALKLVNDFTPDLILLDLLMPVMGGLEFLQKYSAKYPKGRAKVLIFTNMENSPEVAAAYELGAHRAIIKSWSAPHNLAKVVSDSLQTKSTKPASKVKA